MKKVHALLPTLLFVTYGSIGAFGQVPADRPSSKAVSSQPRVKVVGYRVEAVSTLLYDDLVIQESQDTLPETEAASDLLCSKTLEIGIERFVDGDSLEQLRARIEFAGLTQPDIAQALRELCSGLRSFADLKGKAGLYPPGR